MKSIFELTDEKLLRELSTPSNFRLGQEIFHQGGLDVIEIKPSQVTAKARARGGQNRTVVLTATGQGLKCGCT